MKVVTRVALLVFLITVSVLVAASSAVASEMTPGQFENWCKQKGGTFTNRPGDGPQCSWTECYTKFTPLPGPQYPGQMWKFLGTAERYCKFTSVRNVSKS
jgi:hypothetical protein